MSPRSGTYLYVGSALGAGGIRARVLRHCRINSSKHWHIDFLRPSLKPEGVLIAYAEHRLEHDWAKAIRSHEGVEIPMLGFGSSDCQCPAHLFFFEQTPSLDELAMALADLSASSPAVRQLRFIAN